jgi:hypothetical protein
VVALETARTTQLLPYQLDAVEPACSSRAQADALPSEQDRIGRAIDALLEEIGLTGPTGRSARKAVAPEPPEALLLPVGGWPQR